MSGIENHNPPGFGSQSGRNSAPRDTGSDLRTQSASQPDTTKSATSSRTVVPKLLMICYIGCGNRTLKEVYDSNDRARYAGHKVCGTCGNPLINYEISQSGLAAAASVLNVSAEVPGKKKRKADDDETKSSQPKRQKPSTPPQLPKEDKPSKAAKKANKPEEVADRYLYCLNCHESHHCESECPMSDIVGYEEYFARHMPEVCKIRAQYCPFAEPVKGAQLWSENSLDDKQPAYVREVFDCLYVFCERFFSLAQLVVDRDSTISELRKQSQILKVLKTDQRTIKRDIHPSIDSDWLLGCLQASNVTVQFELDIRHAIIFLVERGLIPFAEKVQGMQGPGSGSIPVDNVTWLQDYMAHLQAVHDHQQQISGEFKMTMQQFQKKISSAYKKYTSSMSKIEMAKLIPSAGTILTPAQQRVARWATSYSLLRYDSQTYLPWIEASDCFELTSILNDTVPLPRDNGYDAGKVQKSAEGAKAKNAARLSISGHDEMSIAVAPTGNKGQPPDVDAKMGGIDGGNPSAP